MWMLPMGKRSCQGITGMSLNIDKGERVAIMGPSGSGEKYLLI